MAGAKITVSLEELDNLQIDTDRILYWDGEVIQTMSKYSLPWWISAAAIMTGVATFGMFVVDLLDKLGKFSPH